MAESDETKTEWGKIQVLRSVVVNHIQNKNRSTTLNVSVAYNINNTTFYSPYKPVNIVLAAVLHH